MDIEGSVDNTPVEVMKETLLRWRADINITNWIIDMLDGRKVLVTKGKKAIVGVKAIRGCPQGGVLSPLLWNLVVN